MLIIEDAAQGFGGHIGGKKAGAFGDVAGTSFFPAKPLGCYGDGGAIFTNDDDLASKLKSIRVHGGGDDKYTNVRIGINGRLDSIQAAIILEKMEIFDNELRLRNKSANYYTQNINKMFISPHIPDKYYSSWAQYSILVPEDMERDKVIAKLSQNNIPAMVYYKIPAHLQEGYQKYQYVLGDFKVCEQASKRIFSIPMHPYLQKNDQGKIIEVLNSLT